MKKLNEDIDTLKFKLNKVRCNVSRRRPLPFELVSKVMKKFVQVFKSSSTRK